jgi:hypothetical protein
LGVFKVRTHDVLLIVVSALVGAAVVHSPQPGGAKRAVSDLVMTAMDGSLIIRALQRMGTDLVIVASCSFNGEGQITHSRLVSAGALPDKNLILPGHS